MAAMSRPERTVVALTGGPESEVLLRRGATIAGRAVENELHSVYVVRPGPGGASDPAELARLRTLTEDLGGTHHTLTSSDPAGAVLDLARGIDATQVVVGVSRRHRLRSALRPGVSDRVVAASGDLDVLVVSHPYAGGGTRTGPQDPLGPRRRLLGWLLAVLGPPLLTLLLRAATDAPMSQALGFLALTVLCALVGGRWPALVAALLGSLLLNFFFTAPTGTLDVEEVDDVVALLLFLLVAVSVASVVDVSARRSVSADLARREADALTMLNRALMRTGFGVEELLDLVRETFGMTTAALVRESPDGGWSVVSARGAGASTAPATADAEADVGPGVRLVLTGRPLPAHDLRVLRAFATHLAVVLDRAELAEQAAAANLLAEGNRMRTALLAAVSHDLRTPLAGIKAAVTTLRSPAVTWTPEDQDGLLAAIEDSTDRLAAIIANLLDMSRLQTGGVTLVRDEVGLDDVVAGALDGLDAAHRVVVDLPEDLPAVRVDAGLLDRVVANLLDNALRHTSSVVHVRAAREQDCVRLLVVDHGPGVPDASKAALFEPFQRLGDAPAGAGIGLGLAVARGLTEAMGGTLVADDTECGGLTLTVRLPAAEVRPGRLRALVQP